MTNARFAFARLQKFRAARAMFRNRQNFLENVIVNCVAEEKAQKLCRKIARTRAKRCRDFKNASDVRVRFYIHANLV
jgi:hypothetical protein